MSSETSPPVEDGNFDDLLKSFIGQIVTVVNPQSYEHAPVGHQLKVGFYKAKVTAMGSDYIVLITEFVRPAKRGEEPTKEPVKQFVPIREIKRLSVMKSERLIHL